jgi:hypothetical protein
MEHGSMTNPQTDKESAMTDLTIIPHHHGKCPEWLEPVARVSRDYWYYIGAAEGCWWDADKTYRLADPNHWANAPLRAGLKPHNGKLNPSQPDDWDGKTVLLRNGASHLFCSTNRFFRRMWRWRWRNSNDDIIGYSSTDPLYANSTPEEQAKACETGRAMEANEARCVRCGNVFSQACLDTSLCEKCYDATLDEQLSAMEADEAHPVEPPQTITLPMSEDEIEWRAEQVADIGRERGSVRWLTAIDAARQVLRNLPIPYALPTKAEALAKKLGCDLATVEAVMRELRE